MQFRISASKFAHQQIAVGTDVGNVHILEIPKNLIMLATDEVNVIQAFFTRERERTEYYIRRWKYHAEQLEQLKHKSQAAEFEKQSKKEVEDKPEQVDLAALKEQFLAKLKKCSEELQIS